MKIAILPEPTEAQKQAGNYKKAHIKIQGMDISIENPKGSYRKGTDENGKEWKVKMNNHYGYFNRSEGFDDDHVDVFIGENIESPNIYVVDQLKSDGSFDESKVMLGFKSIGEAKKAYLSNYSEGWDRIDNITEVDIETFKEWLYDGKKQRKPFSKYVNHKTDNETFKFSKMKPDILNKSFGHKYLSKKPDGKGGWIYTYHISTQRESIKPEQKQETKQDKDEISKEEREKNFKEWFGDSKVVDKDGKPLVVYHGTVESKYKKADFGNEFNNISFFAEKSKDSEHYFGSGDTQGKNIIPVYLSINNPIAFDKQEIYIGEVFKIIKKQLVNKEQFSEFVDFLNKNNSTGVTHNMSFNDLDKYISGYELLDKWDKSKSSNEQRSNDIKEIGFDPLEYIGGQPKYRVYDLFGRKGVTSPLVSILEKMGYDGVRFYDVHTAKDLKSKDKPKTWMTFSSTQIKSATGNKGTFDTNNPDITKSMTKEDKIAKVMREFEAGTLKTANGEVVTDKKQALAIAYSEAEKITKSYRLVVRYKVNKSFSSDLKEKFPDGHWVTTEDGGRIFLTGKSGSKAKVIASVEQFNDLIDESNKKEKEGNESKNGPKLKKVFIQTTWHKPNDKMAMTYNQLDYIQSLSNKDNMSNWPFDSKSNAIRSLTKIDASEIIDALKSGKQVIFGDKPDDYTEDAENEKNKEPELKVFRQATWGRDNSVNVNISNVGDYYESGGKKIPVGVKATSTVNVKVPKEIYDNEDIENAIPLVVKELESKGIKLNVSKFSID